MSESSIYFNEAEFRDRVFACWLGKNVGGTLGMPFEGKREVNDASYYTDVKPGEPAANDDLDLQLLWLKALQDHDGAVDARILGEYWLRHVPVDWNEYGICQANMRLGLHPPVCGEFRNEWKHSNGAWIRTEIWACLAPGCPAEAAKMAREDACVDHGAGEGTLAAIFVASIESAAFVEKNRDRLLEIGLAMIPEGCELARAVRVAISAWRAGKDWLAAREAVVAATEATGWFQAPRNVAFVVVGWLYGRDFGDCICKAVNCGDDTDCTGATLGSLLGILGGTAAIPVRWSEPIGREIKTVAIAGFDNVSNLDDLTDQTVEMAKRISALRGLRVGIGPGATDLSGVGSLADRSAAEALWRLSPYRVVWREGGVEIVLDYGGEPVVVPGARREIVLKVSGPGADDAVASVSGPRTGWTHDVREWGEEGEFRVEFEAGPQVPEHTVFEVAVRCGHHAIALPVVLFSSRS